MQSKARQRVIVAMRFAAGHQLQAAQDVRAGRSGSLMTHICYSDGFPPNLKTHLYFPSAAERTSTLGLFSQQRSGPFVLDRTHPLLHDVVFHGDF